ncbi:coiled-coil domain-containing protein 50 isoform X2 [Siniperca chuatsi]|uniref:coiled-coil domain-containing protein 50 isoform X2 n=1 Tax=Siniperca chuatsi TaxID=119488 RepID=UPI001CE0C266|nr:coiled-coil domain-containing protein 50 isoform X2 [Siniperca chuatsi]
MAECNISIDKNKLPGVKEVCRDFAVLEDHCLAYNLQEQEIESHLASNVNKSRLVQKDLQVAKKLQEEEDQRAKVQSQKQHVAIERQDIEIAQEIQEQLVRQAEQQRQQEEKDAAIARKLQEKEMKEQRRRQKQLEANFEEEYFEDHGAARKPLDLDKHTRHKSTSPGRYDAPVSSPRDHSPDYSSTEPKRSRYPKQDPAAPHSCSRYPEHYLEGGRSRHADLYPEHLLPSRGKHGDRYPDYEPTETGRARGPGAGDTETVVRKKERPARPPPPQSLIDRDKVWDKERDRQRDRDGSRDLERDQRREQDLRLARAGGRDGERSRDRGQSGDSHRERDRQRPKDRQRARTRSKERGLEEEPGHSRDWPREGRASWEEEGDDGERERKARGRQHVHSGREEVFDELRSDEGRGDSREFMDPRQGEIPGRERSHTRPNGETGRIVHRGSGAVVAETSLEFGLSEATKGLTKLDLREQELKDMEVARKLQEEEIKASKMHVRAAQVAQDEEIARLMMEQEKKEYRKNRERENEREREKEKERERERLAMERRRQEGDHRANSEEAVRPRTRDEYEYQRQRNQNKPARPPQPRVHDYENVNSGYGYLDHPVPPRAPTRPEAAFKGAYYKR